MDGPRAPEFKTPGFGTPGSKGGSKTPSAIASDIVVFSGGSAANSLVDVFSDLVSQRNCSLKFVIPISDNGGSSSELIRVFGGPGIGDIRSRLVRLIPSACQPSAVPLSEETAAISRFFNYRLEGNNAKARSEWQEIVDAESPLWDGISSAKRELIRSFLNILNTEIVKRIRPNSRFNFEGASIGNLFLTGARLLTGSLESAILLFGNICNVPEHIEVLPIMNSNFTHHIAAGLASGLVLKGQNDISHPSEPSAVSPVAHTLTAGGLPHGSQHLPRSTSADLAEMDSIEDANLPGSHPSLRKSALRFDKAKEDALPARIDRVWYINPYGQELIPAPSANPCVVSALETSTHTVIYSIGSLYTSIVPALLPRGVGRALRHSPHIKHKILILNGSLDRETGAPQDAADRPMDSLDFVGAIAKACTPPADHHALRPEHFKHFVTHLLYLDVEGAPKILTDPLRSLGVECTRLWGPRDPAGKGARYDPGALKQALDVIVGGPDKGGTMTRRNTVTE